MTIAGTDFSAPIFTSIRAEPSTRTFAQVATADLEGHGLVVAAAVEDAGHEAGPAQAARLARAALGALLDIQ